MRGTCFYCPARSQAHRLIPEPIAEAMGCWVGPILGNRATPPSQGVESSSSSPISVNDREGEAVPHRKPGGWDRRWGGGRWAGNHFTRMFFCNVGLRSVSKGWGP